MQTFLLITVIVFVVGTAIHFLREQAAFKKEFERKKAEQRRPRTSIHFHTQFSNN